MSSDAIAAPYAPLVPAGNPVRLGVTWQHPVTRLHETVGLLECDDREYQFRYLRRARSVIGFQPFLGFGDVDRVYRSTRLFPLFSQRVMSPRRPDYPGFMNALWLPTGGLDWQVLDRSQGRREGDRIRVALEPQVSPTGETDATFFVNGVRCRSAHDRDVEAALTRLRPGDELTLRSEPGDPIDPRAVLVADPLGVALGWVPSVLLDWTREIRARGTPQPQVVRVNGTDVPPAYRLLIRVQGCAAVGFSAFG